MADIMEGFRTICDRHGEGLSGATIVGDVRRRDPRVSVRRDARPEHALVGMLGRAALISLRSCVVGRARVSRG